MEHGLTKLLELETHYKDESFNNLIGALPSIWEIFLKSFIHITGKENVTNITDPERYKKITKQIVKYSQIDLMKNFEDNLKTDKNNIKYTILCIPFFSML